MSGASGKIPAAIQLTPEAATGGPLARVRDGDVIRLDANRGSIEVFVDEAELMGRRLVDGPPAEQEWMGTGRELFGPLRRAIGPADEGASVFGSTLTPEKFAVPVTTWK
jgi:phosphogluconate dehydratase